MEIEFFDTEKHYDIIKQWWKVYGKDAPALDILPRHGLMLKDGNEYKGNVFLYQTDSSLCFGEFIIANPDLSARDKVKYLKATIEALNILAKSLGFKTIFSMNHGNGLEKILIKCGWAKNRDNITTMARAL